jgi:hypothetical protein
VEDTVETPLPKPIPTLSEWAQLIMALLMVGLFGWQNRLQRRH